MKVPVESFEGFDAYDARVASMTDDQIKAELRFAFRLTVEGFVRMAVCVGNMEKRGVSLDDLDIGDVLHDLRRVYSRQVLPEVLVRYVGKPELRKYIASLPLPDQQKIVNGEPVKVVTITEDAKKTHRLCDPADLSREEMHQVFSDGRINSETRQLRIIDARNERAAEDVPTRIGDLELDLARNGIIHKRQFIPRADIEAALRILKQRRHRPVPA